MKKRGFTLIELLAVIVILAIIALIATPAVLNIIEDSRKGAAEASARNIVSAAKTYYMSETMNGRTPSSIDLSTDTLKYDGDQAGKGSITFTNGKPEAKMYINGYCVEVAVDGKVTSEKKAEDECEVTVTPSEPTTYTKYNDGTPLLYDPVNNVKCETSIGSTTGTNDGCMKWYAFLDSEDSSTVNLILDHNTTDYVAWANSGETTPTVVNAELQVDITNWNDAVKSTARLISASEVNQIAPTNPNWSVSDYNTWYYLHTGTTRSYKGEAGSNTYAWLFDNTSGCTTYGCNVADNGTNGYWTSSYAAGGNAWRVYSNGTLYGTGVVVDVGCGVRPVITISKSIFY
jgi:type IV pilus assembly protein PilA